MNKTRPQNEPPLYIRQSFYSSGIGAWTTASKKDKLAGMRNYFFYLRDSESRKMCPRQERAPRSAIMAPLKPEMGLD